MSERERIMLECRYLLSLKKDYRTIARYMNLDTKTVYQDLIIKLEKIDTILFERVKKILNNT